MLSVQIDERVRNILHLEEFGFNSFEFKSENNGTFVKRIRSGGIEDLIIYYYAPLRGNLNFVNVLTSGVTFTVVERIIQENLPATMRYSDLITISNFPGYSKDPEMLNEIVNIRFGENAQLHEERLVDAVMFLRTFVVNKVLPFFDRVTSLEIVNEEIINKIPQIEVSEYISGPFFAAKKQIIMKLCGNTMYEEYTSWLLNLTKQKAEADPGKFGLRYEFYLALTEYLDNENYDA